LFKNIIWDVDGTLFDTYPAITYAISKALAGAGISMAMNVIDGLARQSVDGCLETLSQRHKLEPDLLHRRFLEAHQAVSLANQPPFPGVREVCAYIQRRGGLSVIVTHRRVESTQRLLAFHNLTAFFAGILSAEQGYPRKPDPALFEAALRQYGLDPATTLAVGDRELDIRGGKAAGLQTCLFGQAKLAEPADFQVDNFKQLLTILQKDQRAPV
jgi:HAD superfamily hydrolase (TIGR01509 family)